MGNSESSCQRPAGADGGRGVVGSRKFGEESDAAPSSAAVRAAVKVGRAVARAVLTACAACYSAKSSKSEHSTEVDRRHRVMLGAASAIRVEETFGGGRKGIAGPVGSTGPTVALRGPRLTAAAEEGRLVQLPGSEGCGMSGRGDSRGGGGGGVGGRAEEGGIRGGGGGGRSCGDTGGAERGGVGGERGGGVGAQRRRTRRQRSGAAEEEEEKKGTDVKVAVAQRRGEVEEEKGKEVAARRQGRRRRRRRQPVSGKNGGSSFPVKSCQKSAPKTITLMTLNVWKQEGQNLQHRIEEIGHLVEEHFPDIILFQEVTPNIKGMFRTFGWWDYYNCSDSSENAIEGDFCVVLSKFPIKAERCVSSTARKLPGCDLDVGIGRRLSVASGHLKRHDRPGMHCEIRKTQAKEAMKLLNRSRNAVFGGDMNWDEKSDGEFPLPKRWVDAWTCLEPNDNGWTYDTKSNKSLKGRKLLQKRLDRFVCKLRDFTLKDIKIIGNGATPPSDHFGLLLTICYK